MGPPASPGEAPGGVPIDEQIFSSTHAGAMIALIRSMLDHGSPSVRAAIYTGLVLGAILYLLLCLGSAKLMTSRGRNGILGFLLPLVLGWIGIIIVLLIWLCSGPKESSRLGARSSRGSGGLAPGYSSGGSARLGSHQTLATIPTPPDTQTCSFCRSRIPLDAVVCRVCQTEIAPSTTVA
jgi:TM2 domain-containing membrane protein YozV